MINRSYLSGIGVFLFFALLSVAYTNRATTSTATIWRSFNSPTIGYFAMDYPSDWQSEKFPAGYRGR